MTIIALAAIAMFIGLIYIGNKLGELESKLNSLQDQIDANER